MADMGIVQQGKPAPYDFTIGGAISEAWQKVKGFKATFWGAIGYSFLTIILFSILFNILAYIGGSLLSAEKNTTQGIANALVGLASLPLMVGLMMISIRRSVDLPVKAKDIFNYFRDFWKILGVYIVEVLIFAAIGLLIGIFSVISINMSSLISFILLIINLILILFFIYLVVGYMFAMVIRVEKNLSIWQSLEASRKGVSQHWFKIFFAFILLDIIVAISSIPLLIGLIWTLPLINLFCGVLYRTMFGVEEVR